MRLLSGDFTKMVLAAIAIALPVSYLVARWWLQDFAFSIDLQWWYFAGAGLVALLSGLVYRGATNGKSSAGKPGRLLAR